MALALAMVGVAQVRNQTGDGLVDTEIFHADGGGEREPVLSASLGSMSRSTSGAAIGCMASGDRYTKRHQLCRLRSGHPRL